VLGLGTEFLPQTLRVIDWELTLFGHGLTDVAQFLAEAWILDTFSPRTLTIPLDRAGPGLLEAFLLQYQTTRRFNDQEVLGVAAHFGTHIVYLSSVVTYPPGSRQPQEMVKLGQHILQAVDIQDFHTLSRCPFGQIISL
jgi:hypothetical protein